MKKIHQILVAFFILITLSCSNDDDDQNNAINRDLLFGKWENELEGEKVGNTIQWDTYIHFCDTQKDYLLLTSPNILENVDYDSNCEPYSETVTFVLVEDRIQPNNLPESEFVKIRELTISRLVLEFKEGNDFFYMQYKKSN